MDSDKKVCPHCGQEIMVAAKKCRYCGTWLHEDEKIQTSSKVSDNINSTESDSLSSSNRKIWIIFGIVASVLILCYGFYLMSSGLAHDTTVPPTEKVQPHESDDNDIDFENDL